MLSIFKGINVRNLNFWGLLIYYIQCKFLTTSMKFLKIFNFLSLHNFYVIDQFFREIYLENTISSQKRKSQDLVRQPKQVVAKFPTYHYFRVQVTVSVQKKTINEIPIRLNDNQKMLFRKKCFSTFLDFNFIKFNSVMMHSKL